MRRLLAEDDDDLIMYGCSSHLLNLLGQSVTPKAVVKHIVEIQKYFRNHHAPSGWLKMSSKTVKPQLPGDTRWNSQFACIDSFLRNRQAYISIVEEHEADIEDRIAALVNDFNLYKQAKDMSAQLKPIAIALDKLQSDRATLADACHECLTLLVNEHLQPYPETISNRFKQAISPFHMLGYILHPAY